jgi:hypothetical protein
MPALKEEGMSGIPLSSSSQLKKNKAQRQEEAKEAMSSPPRPAKKMKPNKKTATSQQGLVREMKPTRVRKPNSKYYGSD